MSDGPAALVAFLAIAVLTLGELALFAWILSRRPGAKPGSKIGSRVALWGARWGPIAAAFAFAIPAGLVARSGTLSPGLSGAGMPWDQVTDGTPVDEMARVGERAYQIRCAPCHLPNGAGLPPSYPPLSGSPIVLGPVAAHVEIVLVGRVRRGAERAIMPAFADVARDAELAAILTFERNAWGNRAGAIRPSEVARLRDLSRARAARGAEP